MALLPRRTPPPAWIAEKWPDFNRWLLDLIQIIAPTGGVNTSSLPTNVLNGSGPPSSILGTDGDLYINNTGSDTVLRLGLGAEGSAVNDLSNTRLYVKISGTWHPI